MLLCFYCFEAEAYEQQYQVGATGPNGGTVTTVSVTNELTNTQQEMVGNSLNTTYTYTYRETVVETVQSVSYQTVTVTEEKTDRMIPTTYTDTNTTTSCWQQGVDFCTGSQATGGGSRVYNYDLSGYDNKKGITYGSTVYSHSSNEVVPACSATSDDCQDQFKVTVRLLDNGVVTQTFTNNYNALDWSGSQDYSFTQNVSSIRFNSAQLELYGMDAGYYGGFFGPAFSNTFFDVTYDYMYQVLNQIINYVQMTTIKESTEYTYSSQYIPPPVEVDVPAHTQSVNQSFEIQVETLDTGIVSYNVEVTQDKGGDMQISVNEIKPIEAPKVQVAEEMKDDKQADSGQQNDVQKTTESAKAEDNKAAPSQSKSDSKGSNGGSGNNGNNTAAYGTIMESVRLAVMQQSDAARKLDEYQTVTLPDAAVSYPVVTIQGGNTYDNPYGLWYSQASDVVWNKMVDAQWQK